MGSRLRSALTALALCLFAHSLGCTDDAPDPGISILVVAPFDAVPGSERVEPGDPDLARALDDALTILDRSLTRMTVPVTVARVAPGAPLAPLIETYRPAVLIALDAHRLGHGWPLPALTPATAPDPAEPHHDDRFVLFVRTVTIDAPNALDGAPERLEIALTANTRLGRFYAIYELLRRLGARYYHPEDELLPEVPAAQVRARLSTPTALGEGPVFAPDFIHRSYTFHGAHPLEHLESFSDSRHPIDEALKVNDWIIKNRGDILRGAGRGIAPADKRQERVTQLEALRKRRGLRRTTGITLHNQQQGANADLDPLSPIPLADQVVAVVTSRLAATPDAYAFGIHFGPTELTTTPDLETVALMNLVGETVLSLRPGLGIEINNHTSGSQPVDHFDDLGCPPGTNDRGVADYYDLAFHTDPRFGVRVHTVMFHPLEGPAPVYNQQSFAHKLCLMEKASAAGRPLIYFPESAYWLSWDNAIPVYLPLYLHSRWRDVRLVSHLLRKNGGTLRDHRLFNSGHEWGYWQADYAVGLLHWRSDLSLEALLGELADPFCPQAIFPSDCPARTAYIEVLLAVMASQRHHFLEAPDFLGRPGGLYTMFAGEDPADELGAASGLMFRPVRLPFRAVLDLGQADLARFIATDLAALDTLADDYSAWRDRLTALRPEVPPEALHFWDEVVDGLAINATRARHTLALYRVVVALRANPADSTEVLAPLSDAEAHLAEAETIIRRREAHYRYPPAQTHGGGETPDTAVPNGTTYPFRVHTKTHLLSYWDNRQQQVADLVAGRAEDPDALALTPVFAAPEVPLAIAWPALDGLGGALDFSAPVHAETVSLSAGTADHTFARPGIYRVEGLLETSSAPLPVGGAIIRADHRVSVPVGGFSLDEPDSSVARTVLGSLVPLIRLALDLPDPRSTPDAEPLIALLVEPSGRDSAPFGAVRLLSADLNLRDDTDPTEAFVSSAPFELALPIPDPSTGKTALTVGVREATLAGPLEAFGAGGELLLQGRLSIPDLVAALVALAGFEPVGATETLASVLGFDPNDPPADLAFAATLTVVPD